VRTHVGRCFLSSLVCAVLVLPLPALSSSVLIARIASNKSVYDLHDPIKLKLTLTNEGDEEQSSGCGPAVVSLKVFDSRGRLVPPTRTGGTASADSVSVPCALSLDPGKPTKIYFDDPSGWIDIRLWGYSITHPGSYTLVVRPKVDRFASADNDVRTQDSNKVRVTVVPIIRVRTESPAAPTTHRGCQNVEATVINPLQPWYPGWTRELNLGAVTVEVEVVVGPAGKVSRAWIYKSSGDTAIDGAALHAARESTYSPKLVNCRPTEGNYLFRADFQPH
jgi:TonB family protein